MESYLWFLARVTGHTRYYKTMIRPHDRGIKIKGLTPYEKATNCGKLTEKHIQGRVDTIKVFKKQAKTGVLDTWKGSVTIADKMTGL